MPATHRDETTGYNNILSQNNTNDIKQKLQATAMEMHYGENPAG